MEWDCFRKVSRWKSRVRILLRGISVKVKDMFRRAKGRLLFIDEAYSLVDDRAGNFGDEAINTIIKEMESFLSSIFIRPSVCVII